MFAIPSGVPNQPFIAGKKLKVGRNSLAVETKATNKNKVEQKNKKFKRNIQIEFLGVFAVLLIYTIAGSILTWKVFEL